MSRVAAHLSRRLSALVEARTDGQLLAAFREDRDEGAFAELVRRHGPLVWGACRRLLPDPADAEDAFQASFLVLVRRANRLTGQAAVGPWLYRVAAWTARNVRRRNARALARRRPLSPAEADPIPDSAVHDLRADLDAALLALPEKYRTPLVLCHLQGWTRRDAAAEIGCPEGTLSSLLSRGLDRLRHALRAHDPSKLLSAAGVGVPAVLAANTVRAAVDGKLVAAGVVGSSVTQLLEGVVHMIWAKKATAAAATLCVVFGTGVGVGVSVRPVPGLAGDGDPLAQPLGFRAKADAPPDLAGLKAELAAAEEALAAAEEGVRLCLQKLDLTTKAADKGQVARAEVIQERLTLTRFVENSANAKAARASVLARLEAAEQPAKRGLFEAAQQPAPADPDALKAELATAEESVKAATEVVRLATEKVEIVRKQVAEGSVSKAELLDTEIALTRFKENAASANGKRQALVAKLRAAEQPGKEKPAAPPAKPAADLAALRAELAALDQSLKVDRERLASFLEVERRSRDQFDLGAMPRSKQLEYLTEIVRLEAQARERDQTRQRLVEQLQAIEKVTPTVGPKLFDVTGNFLFHLTVSAKDAEWPYLVKEYRPDGAGVGNTAFDGPAALAKYLARIAKDPAAKGVGVRILAAKDLPSERVLEAVKLVKAAGLPAEATVLDGGKPGPTATKFEQQLLQQFGAQAAPDGTDPKQREALLKWLRDNPAPADPAVQKRWIELADLYRQKASLSEQQKRDAETAKLEADIAALTRQLKELQAKPAAPKP